MGVGLPAVPSRFSLLLTCRCRLLRCPPAESVNEGHPDKVLCCATFSVLCGWMGSPAMPGSDRKLPNPVPRPLPCPASRLLLMCPYLPAASRVG